MERSDGALLKRHKRQASQEFKEYSVTPGNNVQRDTRAVTVSFELFRNFADPYMSAAT